MIRPKSGYMVRTHQIPFPYQSIRLGKLCTDFASPEIIALYVYWFLQGISSLHGSEIWAGRISYYWMAPVDSRRAELYALSRPHFADPGGTLDVATEQGVKDVIWPKQYVGGKVQLERNLERERATQVQETKNERFN